jgi:hypothetical protein
VKFAIMTSTWLHLDPQTDAITKNKLHHVLLAERTSDTTSSQTFLPRMRDCLIANTGPCSSPFFTKGHKGAQKATTSTALLFQMFLFPDLLPEADFTPQSTNPQI